VSLLSSNSASSSFVAAELLCFSAAAARVLCALAGAPVLIRWLLAALRQFEGKIYHCFIDGQAELADGLLEGVPL